MYSSRQLQTSKQKTGNAAALKSIHKAAIVYAFLDRKEEDGMSHVVMMPAPSKRGRKKKATLSRVGPGGETLILAQFTADGQVKKI